MTAITAPLAPTQISGTPAADATDGKNASSRVNTTPPATHAAE